MDKKNCWEVKKCGRQTGGDRVSELGECPAVRAFQAHGINNGINGGRACWVIAGTYCDGQIQGSYIDKVKGCAGCEFIHRVSQEEGETMITAAEILRILDR